MSTVEPKQMEQMFLHKEPRWTPRLRYHAFLVNTEHSREDLYFWKGKQFLFYVNYYHRDSCAHRRLREVSLLLGFLRTDVEH